LQQAKVNSGSYPSPEAFDRDLHSLFEAAKLVIKPDNPGTAYSDLVVLQVRLVFSIALSCIS
jgi:chromatin structure-remodeling complex subunit RSC1/2